MDGQASRVQSAGVTVIEFELERTVHAPIEQVFARLTDIDGHNEWMPRKGSILKHTEQTSPGEPSVGTYGVYKFGMPLWRRVAVRERTITVDALKASFERA